MSESADPTIILLGMMGAGKSTVGRALAERTGRPYLDNDRLVREATGRAPEEIDLHDGTEALHAAEAEALRYALSLEGPLIAGAAAWVVDDPGCQGLLRTCPVVVYLRARPETLRDRIGSGSGRREDATDLAWLRARHAERDTRYQALATLTVDTDELEPGVVADEILATIGAAAAG